MEAAVVGGDVVPAGQEAIGPNRSLSTASVEPFEVLILATAIASRPVGSALRTAERKSTPLGTVTLSTTGAPVAKAACVARFARATSIPATAKVSRPSASESIRT